MHRHARAVALVAPVHHHPVAGVRVQALPHVRLQLLRVFLGHDGLGGATLAGQHSDLQVVVGKLQEVADRISIRKVPVLLQEVLKVHGLHHIAQRHTSLSTARASEEVPFRASRRNLASHVSIGLLAELLYEGPLTMPV
uniref:Uncharacterized protein n=1 Tax=Ixodes ricinus TaxID=34613 RepID=A0A6B0UST8_IXORI